MTNDAWIGKWEAKSGDRSWLERFVVLSLFRFDIMSIGVFRGPIGQVEPDGNR